jgi:hypothetical protein
LAFPALRATGAAEKSIAISALDGLSMDVIHESLLKTWLDASARGYEASLELGFPAACNRDAKQQSLRK